MFNSLDFKNSVGITLSHFLEYRYKDSKINDTSIGQMYYLKCISKAADALYNQLREKIDTKDAVDKKVVASDKFFSVVASTRSGSAKIDPDRVLAEISLLLADKRDEVGNPVYTAAERSTIARKILGRCTTYGKDATVISVVENNTDV